MSLVTSTPPFYLHSVSKSKRIAVMVEQFRDGKFDPHYAGYFHCFNRQLFYEAHDVLENLWLADRQGANGAFYKGLIQLAGAFVHLQKNRLRPSAALFKLARANLQKYPRIHEQLDLSATLTLIENWLARLESQNFSVNPLTNSNAPELSLLLRKTGWLLYDGDCPFCTNCARVGETWLHRHGFEIATLQTAWVRERLGLKPDSELTELMVLTPDGKNFGGADGLLQIARGIWWTWPAFAISKIPGLIFLFRGIYRAVSARYHCSGGDCKK